MPQYKLDRSLALDTWHKLDTFTQGYIEAAMWTLTDDDGEPCGHLGLHDIAEETIQTAVRECAAFQSGNRALLDHVNFGMNDEYGDSRHGHDFWLTRNRHGAGFWDRGYGDVGRKLTDAAHAYGGADWYLGDDGKVYQA